MPDANNIIYHLFYTVCVALLFFTSVHAQQEPSFIVKHYTVEDGLPHNVCYGIIQDRAGYMWFGTDNGLARLDGGEFDVFTAEDGLGSNYITNFAYYQDTLLISTWGGGIRYLDNKQFFKYSIYTASNNANKIYVNDKNFILSGNEASINGKFFDNQEFERRFIIKDNLIQPASQNVSLIDKPFHSFFELSKDNKLLLFGNDISGILQLKDSLTLSPYLPHIFEGDEYYSSDKDSIGNIWFGSKGKLLRLFENKKNQVYSKNLPKKNIISISKWGETHLVLMTEAKHLQERHLFLYNYNTGVLVDLSRQLNDNLLPAYIYVDSEKNIWLSTDGNGIYQFKPIPFSSFQEDRGLSNQFIYDIEEDIHGNIWTGTKGGLFRTEEGNVFKEVAISKKSILVGFQRTVRTENGRFFVSTPYLNEVKGDSIYPIKSQVHESFMVWDGQVYFQRDTIYDISHGIIHMQTPTLTDNRSYIGDTLNLAERRWPNGFILNDFTKFKDNIFWFATNKGVFKQRYGYKDFIDSLTTKDGMLNNHANVLLLSPKDSSLWIGTMGGLCHWKDGKMTCYTKEDGLIGEQCHSLMFDHLNRLWVGTADGLSCFDGTNFISFNQQNGLLSDDVNCLMEDSKKQLWVGGSKGISRLDISKPDFIISPPRISIKKFLLNDQEVPYKHEIEFAYQSSIKAHFLFGIGTHSKDMLFQYKLAGQAWKKMDKNSFELLSLGSGDYKIQFRAKRLNSPWGEPFVLSFSINQPLWLQSWALSIYALFMIGLMALAIRVNSRRQSQKARLEVERLELGQLKEVNEFKSRFFDNISHEFRTPLTLILGSLDQLLHTVKGQEREFAEVSKRNAGVLLELINQLLSLSKLESGQISLDSKQYDLIAMLQPFCEGFETLAEQKGISFQLVKTIESIRFSFDKPKLKIVLSNLLSNAIKFTPDGGAIKLVLTIEQDAISSHAVMQIEDTGTGIDSENLPHVFERFYQVDNSSTRAYEGTGIGLALAKEFVELHKGEIGVTSEVGKGSVFTVKLPLIQSEEIGEEVSTPMKIAKTPELIAPSSQSTELPKLLIVEDNPDMSWYIHSLLSPSYFINLAKDGLEGLALAQEWMPDLIISDVMMPNMSGTEMCQKLKSDEQTSHIPIILLTAKADQQDINEGLGLGADEYLTKPFNQEELMLRVQNMIAYRQRLKQEFYKNIDVEPSQVTVTSADENFLSRVILIVEENIANSEFKAADLVDQIGMSRSLLYKKLKALTDLSTSEFIRAIRLKRAAKLIQQNTGNLSDICYKVGFSSLSYFSRSFSKHFGVSPTEYQESLLK